MPSRQELSFADLERLKSRLSTETTALHNDAPEPYAYCSLSMLEIPGGGGSLVGQPGTPAVRTDLSCVRRRCRQVILVRHLLAVVLQRMWDFAVILLLTKVGPRGSFSLVASYGITINVVVALFSPPLGSITDNVNRLSSVVACAAVQNVCVVCCALSFMFLLLSRAGPGESSWIVAMVIVHVCGALNNLFYQQTTVILERDWVVVIAGRDDRWLRGISANLRQINLICNLFAPLLVALLHMISYRLVVLVISGGNCLMILVQYSAFREVYRSMPELCKGSPGQTVCRLWRQGPGSPQRLDRDAQMVNHGRCRGICEGVLEFFAHSTTYIRQRSMLAGLALAMAYLTVLSFHYVMVAYLLMRGLSIRVVGVGQGLASASGILGIVFYDSVAGRLGPARSGLVGIWIQVCCLTVAIPCLLCPTWVGVTDSRALLVFVFAVICSRFGLYAFDVAALQVFQELVAERDRNVVGGFQNTLQSIFELVSFIMVFCLSRPDQFGTSALVSYYMTVGAAIVYTAFVLKEAILRAQVQAQAKNTQSFESDMSERGPVEDEDDDEDVLETGRAPAPPELYSDRPSSLVLSRLSTIASVGSFESLCSTPVRAYTPTRSDLRAGPTLQERPSYEEEGDRE